MTADPLLDPEQAPETNGFQLQLGPDGLCRLVLLGEGGKPLAVLTLAAPNADRLARELAGRRDAYEKRTREQKRGPTH